MATQSRSPENSSIESPRRTENSEERPDGSMKILIVPYVKEASKKIERIVVPLGVKTVFRSGNTLRQSLVNVKNRTPHEAKKGVVYKMPCADCDHVYRTDHEKKRLKEHDYAVRRGYLKNGIEVHAW